MKRVVKMETELQDGMVARCLQIGVSSQRVSITTRAFLMNQHHMYDRRSRGVREGQRGLRRHQRKTGELLSLTADE